jgi:hypothetical protein
MDESRLSYVVSHEAWYWPASNITGDVASVSIMREALTDGAHDGVHWEWTVKWVLLGGSVAAEVSMFDDAWAAILEVPELFGRLASLAPNPTPDVVVRMLADSGFHDATVRVDPYRIASR